MIRELPPIKDEPSYYDDIEEAIKQLFKKEIYLPILRELGYSRNTISNAKYDLKEALRSGRLTFSQGVFSGKLNSDLSKELRSLGAKFDRKIGCYRIPLQSLPVDVRNAISISGTRFKEKIQKIDALIAQKLPGEIADKIKLEEMFDRTLWKVGKKFESNLKGIAVAPQLTAERRKRIAAEWENNLKLYIKDFAEKEIIELRQKMQATVFTGNRYESAVKTIQKSYGVSANKAKFLARQETKLLVAKFQEVRYADYGIKEYTWHCVVGSKLHPVRPRHKALADASKTGKIYRYDDPPVTSEPGQPERRNNPGEDFNCRCFSRPVVRFKK